MSTPPKLTRTYYYDGELLDKTTFLRDQAYVRDLCYQQNANLFTPGIVSGLECSLAEGNQKKIAITAGMAFAPTGCPLIVQSDLTYDPGPDNLTAGTQYYLLLEYADSISLNTPPDSLQMSKTIQESPKPVHSSGVPYPGQVAVTLCTFTLASDGTITLTAAPDDRVSAKVKIAAQGTAPTLEPPHSAAPAVQPASKAALASSPAPSALASSQQESATADAGAGKGADTGAGQQAGSHADSYQAPAPAASMLDVSKIKALPGPLSIGRAGGLEAALNVGLTLAQSDVRRAGLAVSAAGPKDAAHGVELVSYDGKGATSLFSASASKGEVARLTSDGESFFLADAGAIEKSAAFDDPKKALDAINQAKTLLAPAGGGGQRLTLDADSLRDAAPYVVGSSREELSMASQQGLIGLLIEAVKALSARVAALENNPSGGGETDPASRAPGKGENPDPAQGASGNDTADEKPKAAAGSRPCHEGSGQASQARIGGAKCERYGFGARRAGTAGKEWCENVRRGRHQIEVRRERIVFVR